MSSRTRAADDDLHHPLRHLGPRGPPGREGPHRHGGGANDRRLPGRGGKGEPGGAGRRLPGRGANGGGPDRRAHESARARARGHRCEPVVRDATEPARPRARPRRLVQRLGRRRCHGGGGRGLRQRHRRIRAHPLRVLRHGRLEDHVGPHPSRRRVAARTELRHGGADGPRRRRSRHGHGAARARIHRWWRARGRSLRRAPAHRCRSAHQRRHRPGAQPGGLGVQCAAAAGLGRSHHAGRTSPGRRGVEFRRHAGRGRPRRHRRRRAGAACTRVDLR